MAKFENFYENIQEAQMRLRSTVVMYDKEPVYIWAVTDHKGDGVFRAYISPSNEVRYAPPNLPINHLPHGHSGLGSVFDEWLAQQPPSDKFHILRKKLNSPLFDRFRPFPLGMINLDQFAVYAERQPQRPKTEQGLTQGGIYATLATASASSKGPRHAIDMFSDAFRDCVLGNYPSPKTVLDGLLNPRVANESVAFHRRFALVKGPIGILFLEYKDDIIGVLPNGDFSKLKLGKEYLHCREVVDELNLFATIVA